MLADPVSGPIIFIFICFNCVLGTCFDVSKCSPYIYPPIKNSDSVLFPGGNLLRRLLRGPIVFNLCFTGIGNGSGGFKNTNVNRPFSKLENVLFDGVGGLDGVPNGFSNFLHTLWVYR